MKMISMTVELYERYMNRPAVKFNVDKVPRRNEMRFTPHFIGSSTLYVAEKDGAVRYMLHSPDNQSGYGSQEFDLTLVSGQKITVKGPWSSRAGVVNSTGRFGRIMDAQLVTDDINEYYHSVSVDWILSQGLRVGQFINSGETTYEVLRPDGQLLKPLSKNDKSYYVGEIH